MRINNIPNRKISSNRLWIRARELKIYRQIIASFLKTNPKEEETFELISWLEETEKSIYRTSKTPRTQKILQKLKNKAHLQLLLDLSLNLSPGINLRTVGLALSLPNCKENGNTTTVLSGMIYLLNPKIRQQEA